MITVYNGSPSSILFDITAEDGSAQDIATLAVEFKDGNNVTLLTFAPSHTAGDIEVLIPIAGNVNQLADPTKSESRLVKLRIFLQDGTIKEKRQIYLVIADAPISFMDRSYQTLQDAELVAHSLTKKEGWLNATDEEKTNALIAAFDAIGRFSFSIKPAEHYISDTSIPSVVLGESYSVRDLNEKTAAFVATYPVDFLNAIKKAQVIEANSIITSGIAIDRRQEGVIEETVGESTMKWKESTSVNRGLSKDTLVALSKYIQLGYKIGRA